MGVKCSDFPRFPRAVLQSRPVKDEPTRRRQDLTLKEVKAITGISVYRLREICREEGVGYRASRLGNWRLRPDEVDRLRGIEVEEGA